MKTVTKIEPQQPILKSRKRVAAYARVSMETERLQHSLSAQISYYNDKIQKNPDWLFAGVYVDDGISDTGTAKREEFNRMIADADAGKIDIILTKSISRFARNTVDLLAKVRHLREIGVEVWFERENIHSLSGDGELMLSILASFAQEESRSLSDNCKWGIRKRMEQGIPNGHFRVYGYRWDGDELVPVPEEAAIVKRIFQNFLDAKAGDMIIGYESNPVKKIVAIGRVSAEQDGEKLFFEKVEGLTSPIDYATLRGCPELERMEYFQNPQGSLFKLTRGEYDFILDMIRDENPVAQEASIDAYTKSDFLDEVYMTEKRYENLVAVLRNKKNIILQGAPGVGKTFAARRLAWSMMGEKDDSRIEFVQFHQNYSYEDFMMGYKPVDDGFELKYGIFYRFCQKAANQPDKEFFFIIDEINRGNMSKIFGELLMLIEKDYRGTKATLAYNGLSFSVPKNLYIIGMMNTADRSLAMIDYALRRRFSFFEVEPGFDSEGFIHYQNSLNNETLNELVNKVKDLNREISLDKSLGKGFCIGHSYFCGRDVCTDEWLHSIVDYDILPMLSEYWFDDANKLQRWENILQGVFQ